MARAASDESARDAILDGIRAIAILLVLFWHWAEWPIGYIGVQIFFVLSGFLITRILFSARAQSEVTLSRVWEIRKFIVRRSLRIVPIYYMLIVTIMVVRHFKLVRDLPWHFFYLSNIFFFKNGNFGGPLSHLWSLSVEEQFYLFWPWLVLFASKRGLPWIICFLITLGPITRAALYSSGMDHYAQFNTLPFSNLDSLGFGALLAWSREPGMQKKWDFATFIGWLVVPSGIAFLALASLSQSPLWSVTAGQFALSAFVAGVMQISQTNAGRRGLIFLAVPPLVYLGRISYGIYLYHMFAGTVLDRLAHLVNVGDFPHQGISGFLLMFSITVTGATLSWFAIERPIMALRSRLRYAVPSPNRAAAHGG